MKVDELIEKLNKHNPKAEVLLSDYGISLEVIIIETDIQHYGAEQIDIGPSIVITGRTLVEGHFFGQYIKEHSRKEDKK